LEADRIEDKEQLSFWKHVQIQNRIQTKIPSSKSAFQFEPNLLDIQTSLDKSDQIPQNSNLP
jgi:hypothetical protein